MTTNLQTKPVSVALAGNPNSGKTTMFNALTGARQHVGNYPGVTVSKREGRLSTDNGDLLVVDLPGTYSLTAYTAEELAARNFLINEKPGAVIDVLDAGTLERSLYLAVQFLELGVPLVLALNMMDEVKKRGMSINSAKLSELMGVPVVETVARTGDGKATLVRQAQALARSKADNWEPLCISYGPDIDAALQDMEKLIEDANFLTDRLPARWVALKYLEGDEDVIALGAKQGALSSQLQDITKKVSRHLQQTANTYPESVISDYRYGYIASLLKQGVVKKDATKDRLAFSDAVDKVVTNTFLGPLIMLGVIYGLFQFTFAIGEIPMGWVEEFFGWLSGTAEALIPPGLFQSLIVSGIIDGVGGVLGFVPLILAMFLCISFLEDLGYMARMAYMLDKVFKVFGLHGSSVMPFIVSGGIPGGCAVPGVMAARTLRSPRERLATILTAPFMSCGAKVPVFILLAAAFFPENGGDVLFLVTLGGWAAALIVARILRSTVIKGESTPFLMELPPYRIPTLRGVLMHTWERGWQYIKKAGTVILAIAILLWAAMTFPHLSAEDLAVFDSERATIETQIAAAETAGNADQKAQLEEQLAAVDLKEGSAALKHSIAGRIGTSLEGMTKFAGFDWRTNIALVGGFAAKEVVVSTLGTAYSLGEVDPEEPETLSQRLLADPAFTTWSAIALIIFTMLYAPCFVTVVAIAKESSWKWAAFSVGFNTVLAFGLSVVAYQIGTALGG